MTVITISRQTGSSGDQIAARVCELLGYRLFDKDMMVQVAADVGLSEGEVIDVSEANFQSRTIFNRLLSLLTTPAGETPAVASTSTWQRDTSGARVRQVEKLGEARAASIVAQTIDAAYNVGNVVIVGRASQCVLKDRPGALHVRVEAPWEHRVAHIAQESAITPQEAEKLVEERDKASAAYVRRFFEADWADSQLYHLLLNSDRWSLEGAAGVIAASVTYLS
ncbi:MAG: cytidylate kinase-like family protein [Anaerolineae bacterium]|nr:cytidylate kinase-like family protein [Anaerolineae bacterium]MCB0256842.1 cytidylate kinase-like family protein [Anaerolineae bacterium]